MDGQGGITFEHKTDGPNGWVFIIYSGMFGLALVIFAMALVALAGFIGAALATLALYAGRALLILSVGQFIVFACKGAALIIEARGKANEAQGRADEARRRGKAWEIAAATHHIATKRGKSLPESTAIPMDFTVIHERVSVNRDGDDH